MENRYLYRAKRKDWKELPQEEWWITGYYVLGFNVSEEPVHLMFEPTSMFYTHGKTDGWTEIDIDTLCRCTEFEDVGGQIIWENDVVLLWDKEKEGCDDAGPYVVRWSKEHGKFEVERPCRYMEFYPERKEWIVEQEYFDFSGKTPQIVVIGNTIDNDELRKMDWEEAEAMLKERKGSHDGE